MHVLTVLDHPDPNTFSAAVARAFMDGAQAAGHSIELADLHAEKFDPRWSLSDINADGDAAGTMPDIAAEQARISRADAICMVFPLFWWGMPAMTKGWVDRVWSSGWAYGDLDDPNRSLQRPRAGVLLVSAGASSEAIRDEGYLSAMETSWIEGTFGYFGLAPRRLELLCGATGSEERWRALLERSFEVGRSLLPAETAR